MISSESSSSSASSSDTEQACKKTDSGRGSPAFERTRYTLEELLEEVNKSREVCAAMEIREMRRYKEISKRVFGDEDEEVQEVASFECTHCSKIMKSELGLQYHLENFVCRKHLREIPNTASSKSSKKHAHEGVSNTRRKYEKIEIVRDQSPSVVENDAESNVDKDADSSKDASTTNFVCPKCSKVLSSKQNLRYHVNKKVCGIIAKKTKGKAPKKEQSNGAEASKEQGDEQAPAPQCKGDPLVPDRSCVDSKSQGNVCTHCSKSFLSENGLRYHLNNMVCRYSTRIVCTHCSKGFLSENGLEYHLNNMVCRKRRVSAKQSPSQAIAEKTSKPQSVSRSNNNGQIETFESEVESHDEGDDEDYKYRGRGRPPSNSSKEKDPMKMHVCPHCSKVLSSRGGLQYHVDKKVCRNRTRSPLGGAVETISNRASAIFAPPVSQANAITPGEGEEKSAIDNYEYGSMLSTYPPNQQFILKQYELLLQLQGKQQKVQKVKPQSELQNVYSQEEKMEKNTKLNYTEKKFDHVLMGAYGKKEKEEGPYAKKLKK
jgi:hypothetical protein